MSATVDALRASMRQVQFGDALLLSDVRPADLDDAISWREIDQLESRQDYSKFMLQHLAGHIRTSHALCIQWDGYVIDGSAWKPSFLDYDYIGAPWPHFSDAYNVGNGGFSLRSKRLLDACAALPLSGAEAEDTFICRNCRPEFEAAGMRFAPEALARQFSFERMKPTGREFGFHGAFNLVRLLDKANADTLFKSLEPGILAPNERRELLRWALVRGRFQLAAEMTRRIAKS
jgi:hypothetical protein